MIAAWNIRGLNNPLKIKEIIHLLNRHKITCFSILETHVLENKSSKIMRKIVLTGLGVRVTTFVLKAEFGFVGILVFGWFVVMKYLINLFM